MIRVRANRRREGFRRCDGCAGLHLEASFTEIIEHGKSKGKLRCPMCTVLELKVKGVPFDKSSLPPPAGAVHEVMVPADQGRLFDT